MFTVDLKIRDTGVDDAFNDAGEQLAAYINALIEQGEDDSCEDQQSSDTQQRQHARDE